MPVHCAPPYGSIQCVTHTTLALRELAPTQIWLQDTLTPSAPPVITKQARERVGPSAAPRSVLAPRNVLNAQGGQQGACGGVNVKKLGAAHQSFRVVAHFVPPGSEATRA
eukprot:987503-Prymnesium_polylepis.1